MSPAPVSRYTVFVSVNYHKYRSREAGSPHGSRRSCDDADARCRGVRSLRSLQSLVGWGSAQARQLPLQHLDIPHLPPQPSITLYPDYDSNYASDVVTPLLLFLALLCVSFGQEVANVILEAGWSYAFTDVFHYVFKYERRMFLLQLNYMTSEMQVVVSYTRLQFFPWNHVIWFLPKRP